MKKSLILLILLCVFGRARAQAPDWEVVASDYQYTMTITAFVTINGSLLTSESDRVAAFVGDELRGSAKIIYVEGADRHLAYLTVYANQAGEEMSFRVYNSSQGTVIPVGRTLDFAIDEQYGSVLMAFSLAVPALSSEAVFYDFGFREVTSVYTDISKDRVEVDLKQGQPFTALIPKFKVSDGAKVYTGDSLVSDITSTDFTLPVYYTIISADESSFTTYEIIVQNREREEFVSSNVITPNGDGSNDFWVVKDAFRYASYTFRIFDANGRVLWESTGYGNDWNGTENGRKVNRGKYFFVVENKKINEVITGSILVLY